MAGDLPMVRSLHGAVAPLLAGLLGTALGACQAPPHDQGNVEADVEPGTAEMFRGGVVDPGVRMGAAGAGAPLDGLSPAELAFFDAGRDEFTETGSVQGEAFVPNTEPGLGPRFNAEGCAICHSQPAIGGTSPLRNPQVVSATLEGARNAVPWFVTEDGPVREARFVSRRDGSPDGGVAALFVVSGRSDAVGCEIAQPDFGRPGNPLTGKGGDPNLIFRTATPVFGAGLIEAIPDGTLLANRDADATRKASLGISGRVNRNDNDGSITRFGWKAQNKSLLLFAGEAYNVEQGITNELFSDERDQTRGCQFNQLPEGRGSVFGDTASDSHSAIVMFATFMRFLAPPAPAADDTSTAAGREVFRTVGCAACHTPTLRTGRMPIPALSEQPANLYSDLLLHDMGSGLADGISQGVASGREFRTAPLWGIGQRIFFLHDGRTSDLVEAIAAHQSRGSEANEVVSRFRRLPDRDKQDLVNFLRSL
jgi:CxxC motif-containing protein (DUF1111 family)